MRSTALVAVSSSCQTSLTEMTKHYRTIIIVFCLALVKPIAFFVRRVENPSASEFTGRKIRATQHSNDSSSWTWLHKGSKSIFIFLSGFNTYSIMYRQCKFSMLCRLKPENNRLAALFNELHVIQNLTNLNRQHFQIFKL